MTSITAIPAFTDNYIWAVVNGNDCVVVDPGDAAAVEAFLQENQLNLCAILITHHHHDHTGGIAELCETREIPVCGPANENIAGVTQPLREGDKVNLPWLELSLTVMQVPGHTRGHIAYYNDEILFCGDTLFAGGCGRLFEGTPQQMFDSLNRLSQLPDTTKVYCTHEYTLANLTFAKAVETNNGDLDQRFDQVTAQREQGQITLPSTIGLEKQTNPFLRCHTDNIKQNAQTHSGETLSTPVDVFTAVRAWKDNF